MLPSEGRFCSMKWSILRRTLFWKALGSEREALRQSERRLLWNFSFFLSFLFFSFLVFLNLLLLTLPVCVSLSPQELFFQYWSFVESARPSLLVTGGRAEPPPSNEGPPGPTALLFDTWREDVQARGNWIRKAPLNRHHSQAQRV